MRGMFDHLIDNKLRELGITLPAAPTPAANDLPWLVTGKQLWIAGQAAMVDGKHRFVGRLGAQFDVTEGREAARIAAINLLAQVKAACGGDWHGLARCVRLCGYPNATPVPPRSLPIIRWSVMARLTFSWR
jgi:hypothetical protein